MASKRGPECDGPEETPKRRRVSFNEVKVFRFRRRQGYVCVPSQVRLTSYTLRARKYSAPGCCCGYSSLVGVLILLFKLKMKLQDSQIDPLPDQWWWCYRKKNHQKDKNLTIWAFYWFFISGCIFLILVFWRTARSFSLLGDAPLRLIDFATFGEWWKLKAEFYIFCYFLGNFPGSIGPSPIPHIPNI